MIKEVGTVVNTDGQLAEIEIIRTSACSACKAKAACGHHAIAQVSSKNRLRVFAKDVFDSKVGQQVEVGIPETTLLMASVLMYFVPILGLVAGAMLSKVFTDQAAVAAAFGVTGLVLGLIFARKQSKKYQANPEFHPQVLSVKNERDSSLNLIHF